MTLLLDTTTIAQADRAEALREAMRTAGVPANVTPLQTPDVEAKLNHWQLDDAGTTLMHREGTGVWLSRTARQVRIADPDRIGLTLLSADRWTFQQFRSDHAAAGIPSLVLVHQGFEYDHRRWDYGTTIAINMERSVLDVPVETVIRASQNLGPDCPLHKLACDYLRNLVRTARDSPDALAHLAATTTNLVRAVICAAAGDSRERDALAASLVERIRLYIDARITDPELSPALIAAAHHISVRHLYNVWGSADVDGLSSVELDLGFPPAVGQGPVGHPGAVAADRGGHRARLRLHRSDALRPSFPGSLRNDPARVARCAHRPELCSHSRFTDRRPPINYLP